MTAYHHVAGTGPTTITGDILVYLRKCTMAACLVGTQVTVLKQSEADAGRTAWQAVDFLLREPVVGDAGHATVWADAVFGAAAENGVNHTVITHKFGDIII
jgi:hypothetical protein